jgi:hypothetical protein
MDMSRRTLIVGGTSAIVGAGVGARTEIRVHRARLANLAPDTEYVYAAVHDGASPAVGSPCGRRRGVAQASATSPPFLFGEQE